MSMKHQSINYFSILFLMCRCGGLTSYFVQKKSSNHITFATTKFSKFLNATIIIISTVAYWTTTQQTSTQIGEIDEIESLSSEIAHCFYYIYFLASVCVLNLKQTHIMKTCHKIIFFQDLAAKISQTNIDVSKTLKYYAFAKYGAMPLIAFVYFWSMDTISFSIIFLYFKFLFVSSVAISGETLLHSYLLIISKTLQQINNIKTHQVKSNNIKNILKVVIDIKQDIQSFSQIYIIFKLLFMVIEIPTTIYTLLVDENPYVNYSFVTRNTVWIGYLILECFLLLWPYVSFCQNVNLV